MALDKEEAKGGKVEGRVPNEKERVNEQGRNREREKERERERVHANMLYAQARSLVTAQ